MLDGCMPIIGSWGHEPRGRKNKQQNHTGNNSSMGIKLPLALITSVRNNLSATAAPHSAANPQMYRGGE